MSSAWAGQCTGESYSQASEQQQKQAASDSVTCYPYDGHNEPMTAQAVLGNIIPAAAIIVVIATGGIAAAGAIPTAGTVAAALAPLVEAPALVGIATSIAAALAAWGAATGTQEIFQDSLERTLHKVEKTGHYANGDWLNVRGGIKRDQEFSAWQPMRFEYYLCGCPLGFDMVLKEPPLEYPVIH